MRLSQRWTPIGGKTSLQARDVERRGGLRHRDTLIVFLGGMLRVFMEGEMKKLVVMLAAALVVSALAIMPSLTAGTIPASKAAAKISDFVALYKSCAADSADDPLCRRDSGWHTVHTLYIKTPNTKDLAIDTAFECGLTTFTGVASKNGDLGVALAAGRVRVRVQITDVDNALNAIGDPRYAAPSAGPFVSGENGGVVYCSRLQALAAAFGGYDCTANLDTGAVTCNDPELVALLLKTIDANAFNFMAADEPPGIKKIEVQARAVALDAAFAFGPDARAKAFSEAFIGAGSTLVEQVRLIKAADIFELPPE